jgi:hypothetical protein
LAASYVPFQLAQVANHLSFYQITCVYHVPKIVTAVTAWMTVLYASQASLVYKQNVILPVKGIVLTVNVKMIRDFVHNANLVFMDNNVLTTVVFVPMHVVIYVPARMVAQKDIMSLQTVLKQYVKSVRLIVNNVRMVKHVQFVIMVFTSIS